MYSTQSTESKIIQITRVQLPMELGEWNRFRIGGVIDESRGLGALEAEEVQLGMQGWL